jgi:hypothetical protein
MSMWKCARPETPPLIVGCVIVVSLLAPAPPAMAGQGAANPAGITGVVTDNTGAIRRCRSASIPCSSNWPVFRTSAAKVSG